MSLITLILLTLDTSGLSLQEQGKPLKTETKDYYETWQAGAPIDMPASKKTAGYEIVMDWIYYWSDYYGYDDIKKAEAIVSCEGGFDDPAICNKQYGCRAGQGHAQFIPSTWAGLQKVIGVENVFDTSDNIQGLIYLLQRDGDRHWRPYSGHCWVPKL